MTPVGLSEWPVSVLVLPGQASCHVSGGQVRWKPAVSDSRIMAVSAVVTSWSRHLEVADCQHP